MASQPLLPLVDRVIPEGIEQFLATARANGDSNRTIAAKLLEIHDIDVTHPTIGKWCEQYGITKPEVEA